MNPSEFDRYSDAYPELLKDPIREWFSDGRPEVFSERKRDIILSYVRSRGLLPGNLRYLDVGCGKGELLNLLRSYFPAAYGCDPSSRMLAAVPDSRVQDDPLKIPYSDREFDFLTAVCVFHHVADRNRLELMRDIRRVMKPEGTICLIEHNPFNPDTRRIVSRSPIDANATLMRARQLRECMSQAGIFPHETTYFLYLPERWYRRWAWLERLLRRIPVGGQYAVFGTVRDRS